MTNHVDIDIKLPEAIHKSLQAHADKAGVPIEHFIQAYLYLSIRSPDKQPEAAGEKWANENKGTYIVVEDSV